MKNCSLISILLVALTILSFNSCEIKRDVKVEIKVEDAFVHSAYFWFKEDATQAQIDAFIADSEKLRDIKTVKGFFAGKPANTDRPVIENTYDYAVVFLFEDFEAQEYYQQDQIHLDLIENHSSIWERVMVTDIE